MVDIGRDILVCCLDPILQLIGKYHLRQLALTINRIGTVVLVPVHIVEQDCLNAHIVAKAGHDHDPPLCLVNAIKEHAAEHEMAIMVDFELAFETILGEFLCRHLRDGSVADQCINPGNGPEQFVRRRAHARKVHADKAHISAYAELLFQRQPTVRTDGLTETGMLGVKLFRATQAVPCAPAVYESSVIVIASGTKEAVLDGARYIYDSSQYMLCPMSMPVKAGIPAASPDHPLYGGYISLNPRVMGELAIEMENAGAAILPSNRDPVSQAIRLAPWDQAFSDALLRLLQLGENVTDTAVLGEARLRELYYAVLKGDAGVFARQAFGAGNAIARSIAHVLSNLSDPIAIDDMATRAGMSRAVFHRKF